MEVVVVGGGGGGCTDTGLLLLLLSNHFSDFCIAYLNKGKCVLLFFMRKSILKWRSLVSAEPSEW